MATLSNSSSLPKYSNLTDFLIKHYADDKNTGIKRIITHTRIAKKELGIYGGSYHIDTEELHVFHKLYVDAVFKNGNREYLTEKQLYDTFVIDFDFRYSNEIQSRQHTEETINDIVSLYLEEFKKYFEFEENNSFPVFVFEKPNVNLTDGTYTKDGIHIIFGLKVNRDIQLSIRNYMIKEIGGVVDLPLTNSWDAILDEGISKGTTNWQLYGSKKPENEAYQLTYHFNISFNDTQLNINKMNVSNFDIHNNFQMLSVQYPLYTEFKLNDDIEFIQPAKSNKKAKIVKQSEDTDSESVSTNASMTSSQVEEKCEIVKQLVLEILKHKKEFFNEYEKWSKLGYIINNETNSSEDGCDLFIKLSLNFETTSGKKHDENKVKTQYYNTQTDRKNKLTISSLYKSLESLDPDNELLLNWKQSQIPEKLNLFVLEKGENDIAKCIAPRLINTLVFCNDEWWCYNKKNRLWEKTKHPNAMITNFIQQDIIKEQVVLLNEMSLINDDDEYRARLNSKKVKYDVFYKLACSRNFSNQVIEYLKDYLKDNMFSQKLDNGLYKMVFENGIFDLTTMSLKEGGIKQEDFITKTIPFKYQKPTDEELSFVKTSLKKICNWNDTHLNYYLSSLGYAFTGDSSKEQNFWYFRGQTASNGKSVIFEVLEKLMPNYVQKANSDVLDKGADLRKEINGWSGLKLLWLNEVSTKVKDEDLVKATCDGTTYKYNKLWCDTAPSMAIQFKLFAVSNNSLVIKGDAGVKRRFRLGQFNSQFKDEYVDDDYDRLEFIKDKNLSNKLCGQYKHALIHLIMEYSNRYYNDKALLQYPAEWKEEADDNMADNDGFGDWFEERCEVKKDALVHKNSMDELFNNSPFKNMKLKDEIARLKLPIKYDSQKRLENNKNKYKGFWVGFSIKGEDSFGNSLSSNNAP